MEAVNTIPAHSLLERKDKADNHSTRKTQSATQSFFSTLGFNTSGSAASMDKKKATADAAIQHNPLKNHSISMVTTLQSVDNSASTSSSAMISAAAAGKPLTAG